VYAWSWTLLDRVFKDFLGRSPRLRIRGLGWRTYLGNLVPAFSNYTQKETSYKTFKRQKKLRKKFKTF
jgi:hypothetical protein